ncbi:uncharacterized protein LOC114358783 [Ostrinia furnacalis]|uniref:uncharacterized protein LOC114358783 n=1 Tax=Ostrinia furnacalis TaxID=93504 RepID=UPI00103CBD20|nr:uncharacterized protein LOC114358783 [Ostrinia furnacalis]
MSSPNGEVTYQICQRSLLQEAMAPSAPTLESDLPENMEHTIKEDGMTPCCVRNRLKIEADIKKAQLRKEQLTKERKIMEEEFKVKDMLLDAEMELAISSLKCAEEGTSTSNNSQVNYVDRLPNCESSFGALNQVRQGWSLYAKETKPEPIGLEYLSALDSLWIREVASPAADEWYEVVAPGDVVILRVILSYSSTNTFFGRKTSIQLDIFDNNANELINLRADSSEYVRVFVCGELFALINRAWAFRPILVIRSRDCMPVLKVKAPHAIENNKVIRVQTVDKQTIGRLDKCGVKSPGHHAFLTFPLDLHAKYKAALIASSFLIVSGITKELRKRKRRVNNGGS